MVRHPQIISQIICTPSRDYFSFITVLFWLRDYFCGCSAKLQIIFEQNYINFSAVILNFGGDTVLFENSKKSVVSPHSKYITFYNFK